MLAAADTVPVTSRAESGRKRKHSTGSDCESSAEAFVIDTRPSDSLARLLLPDNDEDSDSDKDTVESDNENVAAIPAAAKAPRDKKTAAAAAAWRDEDDDDAEDDGGDGASGDKKSRRSRRQRRIEFLAAFGPTPHYLDADRLQAEKGLGRGAASGRGSGTDSAAEDDEEETRALQVLAPGRAGSLPSRRLAFERLAEANKESPSHRRLTSVRFNPRARVLLTASTDQRFALFQVDTDRPVFDRLHSHHMPGFPVHCARFTPDGCHVVLASVHRSFKLFDIMAERLVHVPRLLGVEKNCKLSEFEISPDQKCIAFIGKYGEVYLVDFKTRNRVCTLRSCSSSVQALAFSPDSQRLLVGGSDGQVSVFSMRHNHSRCVSSFRDEGSTGLTSLAACEQFVACGSSCGIVNLYDWDSCAAPQPGGAAKPQRTAMNLTTECGSLRFNPTEELLLMASRQEPQAVRLLHLATGGVMQNFPPSNVRHYLAAVHSADFSPNGGFLCLGQHTGRAALFRLPHYPNY